MRVARILSLAVVVTLGLVSRPSLGGEGWPLQTLNTGTRKFFLDAGAGTKKLLVDVDTGTRKLLSGADAGAKKLLLGTRNLLTGKKPAPPRTPANPYSSWMQDPNESQRPGDDKNSWLDSLLGREEPKRVESLKDWVGLPRLDP